MKFFISYFIRKDDNRGEVSKVKKKKREMKSHMTIMLPMPSASSHSISGWISVLSTLTFLLCKRISNTRREVIKETFVLTEISLASALRNLSQTVTSLSTWYENMIHTPLNKLYYIINGSVFSILLFWAMIGSAEVFSIEPLSLKCVFCKERWRKHFHLLGGNINIFLLYILSWISSRIETDS